MEVQSPSSYSQVLKLIGPNGGSWFVHYEKIASQSPIFEEDVHDIMQEESTDIISIPDVDGAFDDDTISHFVKFVYDGDYIVPEPELEETAKGEPPENNSTEIEKVVDATPAESNTETTTLVYRRYKRSTELERILVVNDWTNNKLFEVIQPCNRWVDFNDESALGKKQWMWTRFHQRARWLTMRKDHTLTTAEAKLFDDYPVNIECHAKLALFASRYRCEALGVLALQKLCVTLTRFDPRNAGDRIIWLIKHVYSHMPPREYWKYPLRDLVMEYIACHIEVLMKNAEFRALLCEAGPFAKDVLTHTMARLVWHPPREIAAIRSRNASGPEGGRPVTPPAIRI